MDDHCYSIKSFHFRATSILTGRLLKASSVFMIHLCNVAYCFIFWCILPAWIMTRRLPIATIQILVVQSIFWRKERQKDFNYSSKGTLALRCKARSRDVRCRCLVFIGLLGNLVRNQNKERVERILDSRFLQEKWLFYDLTRYNTLTLRVSVILLSRRCISTRRTPKCPYDTWHTYVICQKFI